MVRLLDSVKNDLRLKGVSRPTNKDASKLLSDKYYSMLMRGKRAKPLF